MTGIAMGIVLAAAFLHATWNYLAKCSQNKLAFIWWFILCALVFYLPMFLYYFPKTPINTEGWLFVLATGVIHFFYFWFLGTAYEKGDLSLVYPLARGSGPLLVPFLALMLIKEDITLTGGVGIALIVLGIYLSHLHSFTLSSFAEPFRSITKGGSSWALFTGLTIAAYSLIDKIGVGLVYPPVYIYFMLLLSWVFLTPLVLHHSQGPYTPGMADEQDLHHGGGLDRAGRLPDDPLCLNHGQGELCGGRARGEHCFFGAVRGVSPEGNPRRPENLRRRHDSPGSGVYRHEQVR